MINAPRVEVLSRLDNIQIKQGFETAETLITTTFFPCIETENTYFINDTNNGNNVMTLSERSNPVCRIFCSPNHNATIIATDKDGREVFRINKPFSFFHCCNCCPFTIASSETIVGNKVVGTVKEKYCAGCFTPNYTVEGTKTRLNLQGPTGFFGGCFETIESKDMNFEATNEKTGKVSNIRFLKQGSVNFGQLDGGLFSDADGYKIMNMKGINDYDKANIISAMILMDYHLFEGDTTNLNEGCHCCTVYFCGCVTPCKVSCNDARSGIGGRPGSFYTRAKMHTDF